MELTHEFTVPASLDETWAAFNDIESVGGCFPGAVVTLVEGDTFQGTCKVKLGPIALVYSGTGTFIEKDESSHTMKIQAKGKDKRGNGTAGADVVATMVDSGDGTTVKVVTDLAITGKPAQFGRGVMQDVSDKLLGQFVECLKTRVGTSVEETADAAAAEAAAQAEAAAPATEAAPAPAAAPPASAPRPVAAAPSPHDDALDLGATVIPILIKSYGKQIVAGLGVLAVLVVLWRLIRR
ncbi:SRPBCC family protein [Nocardioides sp.]|uniref:SRPBCC family protein n=1 Tax=Nocardioides sp. TaxID=35761 RepID=UPI003D09CCE6